jgi:hypothetical protein
MGVLLEWIKSLLVYGIMLACIIAMVTFIPKCSKVGVPSEYSEINGIEQTRDYALDPTVTLSQLSAGDGICWRLAGAEEQVCLGWFAGGPGDVVTVDGTGKLACNGKVLEKPGLIPIPACRIVVPEGHFFAVTNAHNLDSIKHGPLPQPVLRGKVSDL